VVRRLAAGEPRHGEIEAAPEEVHRARLAAEVCPELLEDTVDLEQDTPEPVRRVGVIRFVHAVFRKRNGFLDLVWSRIDRDGIAEALKGRHDRLVEVRCVLWHQRNRFVTTVTGVYAQLMIDEVEGDAERAVAVRDRGGRHAARRYVERDVPGMIQPRRLCHTYFADDLSPHVQRCGCVAPVCERQCGPGFGCRGVVIHRLQNLLYSGAI
jgi:hypothetical protein